MRLDSELDASEIRRILLRDAAETFGPMRTYEISGALGSLAEALAVIAHEPLALDDDAPDLSGLPADEAEPPEPAKSDGAIEGGAAR